MSVPFVSVIIAAKNSAVTLTMCLDSVLTQKACEVIVVDDDSPDGTWQVVESMQKDILNLRLWHRINKRGLASALRDGISAARKPFTTFRHRDPADLARRLKKDLRPGQRPLLMTDGVFPTFGVIAPLPDYVRALEPYGGTVAVDDSHGGGAFGETGRGTEEYTKATGVDVLIGMVNTQLESWSIGVKE